MEKTISTKRIGDGKLPNKYWVSISNDYYYYNSHDSAMNWISELNTFDIQSKTIAVFNTYKRALEFIEDNLTLGVDFDGIRVNSIFVEDRISGELLHRGYELFLPSAESNEASNESTEFTEKKLAEHGQQFK